MKERRGKLKEIYKIWKDRWKKYLSTFRFHYYNISAYSITLLDLKIFLSFDSDSAIMLHRV
jgi:hypothetical protein